MYSTGREKVKEGQGTKEGEKKKGESNLSLLRVNKPIMGLSPIGVLS